MTHNANMPIDYSRTLLMACATVIEETLLVLPEGLHYQVFDFGLHTNPEKLRSRLQEAIDDAQGQFDTIILGYGLCSMAILGLTAYRCSLVVPRVDDCIAMFLGSRSAYLQQCQSQPGTYYLTKGWIEVGDTPFAEYDRLILRFGKQRAERIMNIMLGNYKRLALINTGQNELEKYRQYAQRTAERFGLNYEEIEGSNSLLRKMIFGPWDDEFVVISPGETFRLDQFINLEES